MKILTVRAGVSGHIEMSVSGGARGAIKLASFDNLVLDGGLDRMVGSNGSVTQTLAHCQVGTSNAAVSPSQTALSARIASTSTIQNAGAVAYTVGPPDYMEYSTTFRFATGAAAGNLREVGFGWGSTGNLFSRALTTNSGGTPTDVTVLSDEQLDVTYRVRIYPPTSDVTGNITLDGVSTNYTLRASSVSDVTRWNISWMLERSDFGATSSVGIGPAATNLHVYAGAIGSRIARPGGTETFSSGVQVAAQAYTAGTFFRDIQFDWPLGSSNVGGGFRSLTFGPLGGDGSTEQSPMRFQMEFSPNVAKDATKRLRLTIRFAFTRI